jgi:hypothetical protein
MKIDFSGDLNQFLRLIQTFEGKAFAITASLTEVAPNPSFLNTVNVFAESNRLPSLNQALLDGVIRTLQELGTTQGTIPAIKAVRASTGCSLKEAKDLVEFIRARF